MILIIMNGNASYKTNIPMTELIDRIDRSRDGFVTIHDISSNKYIYLNISQVIAVVEQ